MVLGGDLVGAQLVGAGLQRLAHVAAQGLLAALGAHVEGQQPVHHEVVGDGVVDVVEEGQAHPLLGGLLRLGLLPLGVAGGLGDLLGPGGRGRHGLGGLEGHARLAARAGDEHRHVVELGQRHRVAALVAGEGELGLAPVGHGAVPLLAGLLGAAGGEDLLDDVAQAHLEAAHEVGRVLEAGGELTVLVDGQVGVDVQEGGEVLGEDPLGLGVQEHDLGLDLRAEGGDGGRVGDLHLHRGAGRADAELPGASLQPVQVGAQALSECLKPPVVADVGGHVRLLAVEDRDYH